MRGRKPTPTATLLARGSWRGKARLKHGAEAQPTTTTDTPDAPFWISDGGREHWQGLADELHACGLLTTVDVHVLALLCDTLAAYCALRDSPDSQPGVLYDKHGELKRNPARLALRDLRADIHRLIGECGLSPRARVGIPVEMSTSHTPTGGGFAT